MYIYMNTYTHMYRKTYTYTYTWAHTHTHAHTYLSFLFNSLDSELFNMSARVPSRFIVVKYLLSKQMPLQRYIAALHCNGSLLQLANHNKYTTEIETHHRVSWRIWELLSLNGLCLYFVVLCTYFACFMCSYIHLLHENIHHDYMPHAKTIHPFFDIFHFWYIYFLFQLFCLLYMTFL